MTLDNWKWYIFTNMDSETNVAQAKMNQEIHTEFCSYTISSWEINNHPGS